jgi:RNA polymerase sigma-54 factor
MLKHWDRIQRGLRLTDAEVSRLQHEVRRLNPRPGSSMGEALGKNLQQITPDFIVDTDPYGQLTMTLNRGHVPPLRVSDDDLTFLQSYEGRDLKSLPRSEREGILYLRERVEKARGFIEALQQRRRTLTDTMYAIIRMQRPFFESGDETLLRPMTLEDVAKRTGLHLSTVSRVSNSKWVQTPFGIYPLRWFFTSAARLQGGDEVSVRNIQAAVQEIVDNEDHHAPLSDDAIARELQKRGYDVARRTVSKYREQLNIPVARLRK